MALVCYFVRIGLDSVLSTRSLSVMAHSGIVIGVGLSVGAVVYLGLAFALKMEEATLLRKLLSRR
jgi:hypothetical protein